MKLTFLAKSLAPTAYDISGSVISGIDTSLFVEGSQFTGNEDTGTAGIFDMFWEEGELHIVLAQPVKTIDLPWSARASGWIDAGDYDPHARYVVATNPQALALLEDDQAEYWKDPTDGKWSVRMIETEEQEPAA
ncbi:hypothetical protein [Vreelandella populi]|uniref:hypothetical protein n=1 Tax=Vreelandella populi TaxID=2498858 RepID=UPI000F8E6CD5|nr:hypothetical protein [Halomonas populi]RUR51535.1 hypothetical protein ELY40_17210 [Halomonas populi]